MLTKLLCERQIIKPRMNKEYLQKMKNEASFYDHSFKAKLLGYESYYIFKLLKYMRLTAYYCDRKDFISHKKYVWYCYKMRKISLALGIHISPHSCDWGIKIWHSGDIIINDDARIGKNLTIYPGCIIGHKNKGEVPIIGDNCFLGGGAKIFGKLRIGDNVTIAPNAVVTKDIPSNSIVGGVPAKIIKHIK